MESVQTRANPRSLFSLARYTVWFDELPNLKDFPGLPAALLGFV